jgi:hypothetical protein
MGSVCRIAALYTVATNDFESDPRLATEYVPGVSRRLKLCQKIVGAISN